VESLPSQERRISFEDLAAQKGYSPKRARRRDFNNVSHLLTAKGKDGKPIQIRFDVKKIKNKKQSQDWLWVEFKNAQGEDGWLHGEANFVAFERTYYFIVVNRKELLAMLSDGKKIRYDLPFVNLAKRAKYRIYKRAGTKEEITQISVKDLKKLKSYQLWEKKDAGAE
jgi:hypothetical protein